MLREAVDRIAAVLERDGIERVTIPRNLYERVGDRVCRVCVLGAIDYWRHRDSTANYRAQIRLIVLVSRVLRGRGDHESQLTTVPDRAAIIQVLREAAALADSEVIA